MSGNDIAEVLEKSKIIRIKREANIIKFIFQFAGTKTIKLYARCYVRFLYKGKLLLSSENLYFPKNGYNKKFYNGKANATSFDEIFENIKDKFYFNSIEKAQVDFSDIKINLSNGYSIDVLRNFSDKFYLYPENYRIISKSLKIKAIV